MVPLRLTLTESLIFTERTIRVEEDTIGVGAVTPRVGAAEEKLAASSDLHLGLEPTAAELGAWNV